MNRKIAGPLLLLAIALSFYQCERWVDERADTVVLTNVLGRITDALEDGSMETLSDYILKEEMLTVIGLSRKAQYSGWKEVESVIEETMLQLKSFEFIIKARNILPGLDERTAYFLQIMTVSGKYGEQLFSEREFRISGVFERHGGRWVIVFVHISSPSIMTINSQ